MSNTQRNILVTAALPYANGPIHLGHLLEYIQADIWTRFQRLQGNHCLYICGDDAHGTAIMLSAEQQGIPPEDFIAQILREHEQDISAFLVEFDNFYTTHSIQSQQLCEMIYKRLKENNDIVVKVIEQAYDPIKKMFLPDRFIRGTCPRCHAQDQYGDVCENCGATYSPTELIDAVSVLSGAKPITQASKHYFFAIDHYTNILKQWVAEKHLQPEISNKLKEWFTEGLKPWNISRDAPYFGFIIPDTTDKYFYVWLDAPIGYMASLQNLAEKNKQITFSDYWEQHATTELYHFIGKDIVYFHALFWPALLYATRFRLPTAIYVHGYLTIDGKKMSKSRGTFITAQHYLQHLHPEYLRYYFASKLTHRVEDIDLNWQDLKQRINSDLIGKYVNIASRCAGFIHKLSEGQLADHLPNADLYTTFLNAGDEIATYYETRNYNKAMRTIMKLADHANEYIDKQKPWVLAKQNKIQAVQAVCTEGLNLFKILTIYLKPVLPETSKKVAVFLNTPELSWKDLNKPLLKHKINVFHTLMTRIADKQIDHLIG